MIRNNLFLPCKHVCVCLTGESKMWQRLARPCPRVCSGTSSESWDLLLYPLTIGGHFIQSILHADTHILNDIQLIHETLSLRVLKEWEGEGKRERGWANAFPHSWKSMRSIKGSVSFLPFHVLHAAINMFEINHALCINKEKNIYSYTFFREN